jgi:hypothetical protein
MTVLFAVIFLFYNQSYVLFQEQKLLPARGHRTRSEAEQ